VHDLFGPETISFPDVIRQWAGARHETVKFRSMPLSAFRVLTAAAAPVRPLFPVIYSLIRSFNELDWSGDDAESRALAENLIRPGGSGYRVRRQPDQLVALRRSCLLRDDDWLCCSDWPIWL